jgi:TRAP-type C4-dicarboxylate transport system permease small subunit
MQKKSIVSKAASIVHIISNSLGTVCAVVLFIMALISTIDVIGRYIFNSPLPGAQELVEIAMSVSVYTGIALAVHKRNVIIVPVFTDKMPERVRYFVISAGNFLCFILGIFLSYEIYIATGNMFKKLSVATALLRIPYAPFYLLAFICCIILTLEFLIVSAEDFYTGITYKKQGITEVTK